MREVAEALALVCLRPVGLSSFILKLHEAQRGTLSG